MSLTPFNIKPPQKRARCTQDCTRQYYIFKKQFVLYKPELSAQITQTMNYCDFCNRQSSISRTLQIFENTKLLALKPQSKCCRIIHHVGLVKITPSCGPIVIKSATNYELTCLPTHRKVRCCVKQCPICEYSIDRWTDTTVSNKQSINCVLEILFHV